MSVTLNEFGKYLPSLGAINAYAIGGVAQGSASGNALLGIMFGELITTRFNQMGINLMNAEPLSARNTFTTGTINYPMAANSPVREYDKSAGYVSNKVGWGKRTFKLDLQIYKRPEYSNIDLAQSGQYQAALMVNGTMTNDSVIMNLAFYNLLGIITHCDFTESSDKIVWDVTKTPTTVQIDAFEAKIRGIQKELMQQTNKFVQGGFNQSDLVMFVSIDAMTMMIKNFRQFVAPVGAEALQRGIVMEFLGMPVVQISQFGVLYSKDSTSKYTGKAINVDRTFDFRKCDVIIGVRGLYKFPIYNVIPPYAFDKSVIGQPESGWFVVTKIDNNLGAFTYPTKAEVASGKAYEGEPSTVQARRFFFSAT